MRKFLKILLYIFSSILLLLLIAIGIIISPWGKNIIREQAQSFLQKKLQTEVLIGKVDFSLPKWIELGNILLKDQQADTLLSLNMLRVDIGMLELLNSKVDIQKLEIDGLYARLKRNHPDTFFNYQYIIDAFSSADIDSNEVVSEPDSAAGSPLVISAKTVRLKDIDLLMDDKTGGMLMGVKLNSLELKMRSLDIDKLDFKARSLDVDGLQFSYIQDTSYIAAKEDTSSSEPIGIAVDKVNIRNSSTLYEDRLSRFLFDIKVGTLQVQPETIDLSEEKIAVKDFLLDSTYVRIEQGKNPVKTVVADTPGTDTSSSDWVVTAQKLRLNRIFFAMDDEAAPRLRKGMDYAHLNVKDLNLDAAAIYYSSDSVSGRLANASLQEQSGLTLYQLKTDFSYTATGAVLDSLLLKTDKTLLKDYASISYPSIDAITKHPKDVKVRINIVNSVVGFSDVLLFVPDLEKQDIFKRNPKAQLATDLIAEGTLELLKLNRFTLQGIGTTKAAIDGTLGSLTDSRRMRYDLNVYTLQSGRKDIESFVPKSTLESVRLPDLFALSGKVKGNIEDYFFDLKLQSTDGAAGISGNLIQSPGKHKEVYTIDLRSHDLNIGRILKQEKMGAFSGTVHAKGQSFDLKSMRTDASVAVEAFSFNQYNYKNIALKAKVNNQSADLLIDSEDPNLALSGTVQADLSKEYYAAAGNIDLHHINLYALHFYDSLLTVKGKLQLDFESLNPDYPDGYFLASGLNIFTGGQNFFLDSVLVLSRPATDSGQAIWVKADALLATVEGRFPLTKIGDLPLYHFNKHFKTLAQTDSLAIKDTSVRLVSEDVLNARVLVRQTKLLKAVMPTLTINDTIAINANITQNLLLVNVIIPFVKYGDNSIQAASARINGDDRAFDYELKVEHIQSGEKIALYNSSVTGDVVYEAINTQVSIGDSSKTERFALGAQIGFKGDTTAISLSPQLKLNYESWSVATPNHIQLAEAGMHFDNVRIQRQEESIALQSETAAFDSPFTVNINNFTIANITELISQDTLLANGILNSKITVHSLQPALQLNADVQVAQLSLLNDTLGNLNLTTSNPNPNTFLIAGQLKGDRNDLKVDGNYYLEPANNNNFNIHLRISKLELAGVEKLSGNQIRNSQGGLLGDISLKGTADRPQLEGYIETDKLTTTVVMLNVPLSMPSERITFTNGGLISFNKFDILDSASNKLTLDGNINIRDLSNPVLALKVQAREFKALNASRKDNKLFYGDFIFNTNLSINGKAATPTIDGSLSILKGTDLTITLPESAPTIQDNAGIVSFVNFRDSSFINDTVASNMQHFLDTFSQTSLNAGTSMNVNIDIDENAEFNLIIDPATGDFLRVRGKAALNTSIDPSGRLALAGNYQLSEGAYQLNYNFLKRKFEIQNGSVITFAGDPLKSQMNITAVYNTLAAPYELVEKQVSDPSQLVYYKERIPFQVQLRMKGGILTPDLFFDVVLPDNKTYPFSNDALELIRGKLSQLRMDTSEVNKQVFSLLILNRFVAEDPFASGSGMSASLIAKQSVSRFISEQVNQLAGNLIKGVELSVDLSASEDYTTGARQERTDLNIAASKRVFNDRLKLTIGNNFELEGPRTNNNQNSSMIPGNLAADYNITPEGKYILRAYRQNHDKGILQGFVTETGLNFIMNLEYNRFRYLFTSERKRRAQMQERRNSRMQNDSTHTKVNN